MSRNIKEIGKELMGKSLNSYHRKTGLTQLEKNNEMQDGILNGILSQVDDAYIEKTEQSNVIHLDGSGDGVVVLDSIEGNTMVNLWDNNIKWNLYTDNGNVGVNTHNFQSELPTKLKPNTTYTYVVLGATKNIDLTGAYLGSSFIVSSGINVSSPALVTTTSNFNSSVHITPHLYPKSGTLLTESDIQNLKILFIEGDHRDKSLNWFEGLQSSFEEKVNDEGKYEIEILSRCSNLINTISNVHEIKPIYTFMYNALTEIKPYLKYFNLIDSYNNCNNLYDYYYTDNGANIWLNLGTFSKNEALKILNDRIAECMNKSNKIKLLINEPLRAIENARDRLCFKDGKLYVERNIGQSVLNSSEGWQIWNNDITPKSFLCQTRYGMPSELDNYKMICDTLPNARYGHVWSGKDFGIASGYGNIGIRLQNINNKSELIQWLQQNPLKIVYPIKEPVYEEVLNEYGEPIILEGYENGTIYIDSTIVPTTTVRYTPKMESFNVLKEVSNNNIMLTNDINDTIVPYMMEVDLMIMEKEMSLFNSLNKNIRTMEVLDMTSMQKRTGEMLERLIKGKTLNEKECKTRVTVYLNADKITDEQAEELMLLIDEVYA